MAIACHCLPYFAIARHCLPYFVNDQRRTADPNQIAAAKVAALAEELVVVATAREAAAAAAARKSANGRASKSHDYCNRFGGLPNSASDDSDIHQIRERPLH